MKYDKRAIMKQAWEFYRGRPSVSFGEHLKWAWQLAKVDAKEAQKSPRVRQIEQAIRELDYLPFHMAASRRTRLATLEAQLREAA